MVKSKKPPASPEEIYCDISNYLNLKHGPPSEETIYILGQIIHDSLKELDTTDEDKGSILNDVIVHLRDFNKVELAAYRALREAVIEKKASTVH